MKINSSEIIDNSKNSLLNIIGQLNTIEIVAFQDFVLNAAEFRNMITFNQAVVLSKTKFPIIYTIEISDFETRNNLIEKFLDFSSVNKTKNNEKVKHSMHNNKATDSKFLYVGSSMKNFSDRLKDHLGVKKVNTIYALHLSKWDENITYSIRIKTYEIKHINNSLPVRNIVEIIEQQIWDSLKPIFGKRSGLL